MLSTIRFSPSRETLTFGERSNVRKSMRVQRARECKLQLETPSSVNITASVIRLDGLKDLDPHSCGRHVELRVPSATIWHQHQQIIQKLDPSPHHKGVSSVAAVELSIAHCSPDFSVLNLLPSNREGQTSPPPSVCAWESDRRREDAQRRGRKESLTTLLGRQSLDRYPLIW